MLVILILLRSVRPYLWKTDDDDHPTACQDGFEVCLDESEEEWPGDDAPFVEDEQLY